MNLKFKTFSIGILFLLFGCNPAMDCYSIISNFPVNKEIEINTSNFISGFLLDSRDSRFNLKCILINNNDIIYKFDIDSTGTEYHIKVKSDNIKDFKNGDEIFALFWDSSNIIRSYAAYYLIKIKIKEDISPCDTIKQIIYINTAQRIDKLTRDEITLIDLYDKVLESKIQNYLNSLNSIQEKEIEKCKQTFKLLDWIENSKEFGFRTGEYELTQEIKDYLNIISEVLKEKTNEASWIHKDFSIKVVGYSDERQLQVHDPIIWEKLGVYEDKHKNEVYINQINCLSISEYFEIDKKYPNSQIISTLTDNCSLSALRAYSATFYLMKKLNSQLKSDVKFMYVGGGVSKGTDYLKNRKIEIKIELRAGAKEN